MDPAYGSTALIRSLGGTHKDSIDGAHLLPKDSLSGVESARPFSRDLNDNYVIELATLAPLLRYLILTQDTHASLFGVGCVRVH